MLMKATMNMMMLRRNGNGTKEWEKDRILEDAEEIEHDYDYEDPEEFLNE